MFDCPPGSTAAASDWVIKGGAPHHRGKGASTGFIHVGAAASVCVSVCTDTHTPVTRQTRRLPGFAAAGGGRRYFNRSHQS